VGCGIWRACAPDIEGLDQTLPHSHTPTLPHSHTFTLSHSHTPPKRGKGNVSRGDNHSIQYRQRDHVPLPGKGRVESTAQRPKGPFRAGVDRNSSKSFLQFCSSTQIFLNLREDGKAGHVPRNMIFHHLHCGYLESLFWTSLHSWLEKGRVT